MKLKVQAQNLQPGDVVGSGEVVVSCSAGALTPRGKVDVCLNKYEGAMWYRTAIWGKYTMINVERKDESA